MKAFISEYSRRKKFRYFFYRLPKDVKILEVGSGSGCLKKQLYEHGFYDYTGIDICPPADIVGDIKNWRQLEKLTPASYDVVAAFELVEHVDCFDECFDLLKDGGQMYITTPAPHADWLLKILEWLGLNQKRTSPHNNLLYLSSMKKRWKGDIDVKYMAGLAQWAILTKRTKS